MASAAGKIFFRNGIIHDTAVFAEIYREEPPAVYEVLRIIGGRPLFAKEHYQRLLGSLATLGEKAPLTYEEFRDIICDLSAKNRMPDYNCRLVITGFSSDQTPDIYLFLIPTSYPTGEQYQNGVATDLLPAVRKDPHSKIWNQELRDAADKKIHEEGLFEVILTDPENCITEGSRSNIFFLRGNTVYTTPADAVLLGVTRTRILEACISSGLSVREEIIRTKDLPSFESAFLSGTSPKVLPVASIGSISMDVHHPLLRIIMELYDRVCEASFADEE